MVDLIVAFIILFLSLMSCFVLLLHLVDNASKKMVAKLKTLEIKPIKKRPPHILVIIYCMFLSWFFMGGIITEIKFGCNTKRIIFDVFPTYYLGCKIAEPRSDLWKK